MGELAMPLAVVARMNEMRGSSPSTRISLRSCGLRSLHPHARLALIAAALFLTEVNMSNHAVSFESTQTGAAPKGWTATLTGSGKPKWTVEGDATAPSKSNVIKQSGRASYPLLLKDDTSIKDGFIEV